MTAKQTICAKQNSIIKAFVVLVPAAAAALLLLLLPLLWCVGIVLESRGAVVGILLGTVVVGCVKRASHPC